MFVYVHGWYWKGFWNSLCMSLHGVICILVPWYLVKSWQQWVVPLVTPDCVLGHVGVELEVNLEDLVEVTGYVRVLQSNALTDLNFLAHVNLIRGKQLYWNRWVVSPIPNPTPHPGCWQHVGAVEVESGAVILNTTQIKKLIPPSQLAVHSAVNVWHGHLCSTHLFKGPQIRTQDVYGLERPCSM